MKTKLKILLTVFICFLFAFGTVNAADEGYEDNTSSGGGSSGTSTGCNGEDSCWGSGYFGLRMSLYKFPKNNDQATPTNKIGNTVDFIGNDNGGYRSSGQVTRIEFLNGKNSLSFTAAKGQTASAAWLTNMYKTPGKIPTEVEKHVMGNCYGRTYKDGEDISKYYTEMETCLTPFFQEMGATSELHAYIESKRNNTNTEDIFIIYEPLAGIGITGKGNYFLTGTELAWMYDGSTYKVSWVSSLIRSWPDGNKIKGVHMAATAYQATDPIAGFKPINLATTTLDKHIHNTNRYGVSVGVAKLSQIMKDLKVCVEEGGTYYGKTANKKVSKSQYEAECFPPEDPPDICTFELVTKIVKDCKNGTEGYVKDIEDWDCIYQSRESNNANIREHFYMNQQNRYCSVYCREEVYYYYPGSSLTVRAGHHFSVGKTGADNTLLPVNMTGRSECRITYGTGGGDQGMINYELFKKDWEAANKRVLSAWDTMNVQIAYSDSIKNAYTTRQCAYHCDRNVGQECCRSGYRHYYTYSCGTKEKPRTCRSSYWVCTSRDTPYYHGVWYQPTREYYDGRGYTASGWCSHCGNGYRPETCSSNTSLSSAVSSYNSALRTRNNYLTQLMQCNNFQRTYRDFKPTVQFKYNEGEYEKLNYNYQYSDILDKELEIRAQTNYFSGVPGAGYQTGVHKWNTGSYENASQEIIYDVNANDMIGSTSITGYYASRSKHSSTFYPYTDKSSTNGGKTYGRRATIQGYSCVGFRDICDYDITNVVYPTNDSLRMFTTKEFDYKLYPGVYNYVRKDTGQSLNYNPGKNYYVVGYSNLPTHYSRKTRSDYHFYLDFSPEIFGPNQKFYKFLKLGAHTGITYGEETTLSIYEKLWNNASLNRMINDCCEGGKHLNHNFINAINRAGISTQSFLNTPCAKQFGCYIVSGYKVYCPKDIPSRSCSSNNYAQLRACIQSQVVDRVGNALFTDTDYTYKCTYRILNEIVCPPDTGCPYIGVSAIYRTVDLSDPFPDRSPTGNWTSTTERIYILNNRGVSSNQLYTKRDPMYKITLTPSLISSIRKYNESHDMSDYNLECNTAGRQCKSNFIRKTYASYFSGCGISGKGSSKCDYGEAW